MGTDVFDPLIMAGFVGTEDQQITAPIMEPAKSQSDDIRIHRYLDASGYVVIEMSQNDVVFVSARMRKEVYYSLNRKK